jgi:hypothetical protein
MTELAKRMTMTMMRATLTGPALDVHPFIIVHLVV